MDKEEIKRRRAAIKAKSDSFGRTLKNIAKKKSVLSVFYKCRVYT